MSEHLQIPHRLFFTIERNGSVRAWSPREMTFCRLEIEELAALLHVAAGVAPAVALRAAGHETPTDAEASGFFSRLVARGLLEQDGTHAGRKGRVILGAVQAAGIIVKAIGTTISVAREEFARSRCPSVTSLADGVSLDVHWNTAPAWQPREGASRVLVTKPSGSVTRQRVARQISTESYPLS